jgi:hypothetical protein
MERFDQGGKSKMIFHQEPPGALIALNLQPFSHSSYGFPEWSQYPWSDSGKAKQISPCRYGSRKIVASSQKNHDESLNHTRNMKALWTHRSPWHGQCRPRNLFGTIDPEKKLAYISFAPECVL